MQRVLIPSRIAPGAAPVGTIHDLAGLTMGTSWSVRLVVNRPIDLPRLRLGVQQELDTIVAQMSHWQPDSDLGRFNRAEAGSWQPLPEAFFEVLSYALEVAEASGGAYDPGAGALVNLWGFGPERRHDQAGFRAPTAAAIASLIGRTGIELDRERRRARQPGGVQLDLSAVAKGYGVDQVARHLERQGLRHYLVEVGGELRGAGVKPDGQPWWVALEQPPSTNGTATAGDPLLLALHGLAVATSGDYRRYVDLDGQRHAHTLDPRDGYPVRNGVASVSVIHPECMAADALSTALTVLGAEQGMRFAEAHGLAARWLIRDGETLVERMSAAFLEMLQ